MVTESSAIFEKECELPDKVLSDVATRLVGFNTRAALLMRTLRLVLDLEGLAQWNKRHHAGSLEGAISILRDRYPLVVFEGDVGTGKTVTAEALANELSKNMRVPGHLFKISTRVRGVGHVGQMSALINEAFDTVLRTAGKNKLSFLIIDEGDSLAASRNQAHSHHEDKVAVNTLIQRIDDVRKLGGRAMVFLCTNRIDAVDPAIVRRAASVQHFDRPSDEERGELFGALCAGLKVSAVDIQRLVTSTGAGKNQLYGFTYSDITTRLFPEAIARAFPDRPLLIEDICDVAKTMQPSPSIIE